MEEFARLLAANDKFAAAGPAVVDGRPSRRLAVVTCMDTRIDVLAALGLQIGEAHVIRNAGARVTEDVLRSLALGVHALGVDTVVVMQHTRCGVAGVSNDELRQLTGADLEFLPIADHEVTLRSDVDALSRTAFLEPVLSIAGFIYDVDGGRVAEVVRWERDS